MICYDTVMLEPKITKINYSYQRHKPDLWVLNNEDIPVDTHLIKDQQIVHFSPKSFGGNHSHPRTEWFIGIGDLSLVWLDQENQKHELKMSTDDALLLVEVPPHVPHAVINNSDTEFAVLFEYADGKMEDVTQVEVV